ncbi:hypothetical protein [Demequina rhizosphaerae]|uniref:hypothetical protein n=1 Tax=Demequina rhizosphaerae TaxID=1638985 RepID=UPI000782EC11|nr:hypothetical protein [Demequina rhizosphaerae]
MSRERLGASAWRGELALSLALGALPEAEITQVDVNLTCPPGGEPPGSLTEIAGGGEWSKLSVRADEATVGWTGVLAGGRTLKARFAFRKAVEGDYLLRIEVTDASGRTWEIGPYSSVVESSSRWSRRT